MKILTWNTNGIRATHRDNLFLPLFKKYNPDIVCLQETKAEVSQLPDEVVHIQGYHSYFESSKTRKGYSGVAVYTRTKPDKVEYGIGVKECDDEGRTLVLTFGKMILINCYFPNGGGAPERLEYKLRFYDAFLEFIERKKKEGFEIVFCGDVNVAHNEIDLARPKENETHVGFLPVERAWMDEVIAHGYTDVYRHFFPDKVGAYTYWDQKSRARDRNVGWRIDYFFVTPVLLKKVKEIKIEDEYMGSDHCPLVLELK
jgi:exodeoxyribonuclease-3